MSLYERIMSRGTPRCLACSDPHGPRAGSITIETLGRFCSRACAERYYTTTITGCAQCGYVHEADAAHLTPIISMNTAAIPTAALARIVKAARQ